VLDATASALAHIAAAEVHISQTTISYPSWLDRANRGYYGDVTKTRWWLALNELALAKADLVSLTPGVAAGGLVFLFGDNS
jgi:hypothetical protein